MRHYKHLSTWDGRTVVDFDPETGIEDPLQTAYRLRTDLWDGDERSFGELFAPLAEDPQCAEVRALITGAFPAWIEDQAEPTELVETLTAAAERLPNLVSLFIGDITPDENEISWIVQTDFSPLFSAFPRLETLEIRGSQGLTLGIPRHQKLKKLVIESGGLPASVLQEILNADLPALEHLELYLGASAYGWTGTIDDIKPLLRSKNWPALRYLGLRDSEIADQIAEALLDAPLLDQLETLDLSLGTLGEEGAVHLLNNPALSRLKKLDLHYHYIPADLVERLRMLGPEVDTSDPQDDSRYGRYVAVGE